ncbi:MAG: hypothetical protein WAV20_11015 [Blastocatellia bacterium]
MKSNEIKTSYIDHFRLLRNGAWRLPVFVVAVLVCCVLLAAAARARIGYEPTFEATSAASAGSGWLKSSATLKTQANHSQRRVESEIVVINRTGFETTEISRPAGPFFLTVADRSGLEEVELRLDRVAGSRLHDVRVPREKLDWTEILDLAPGGYTLTEVSHSEWVCHITITPR